MKYYLYLWITGCIGFECPIPDHDIQAFSDIQECEKALNVVIEIAKISKERKYGAICIPEDSHLRIQSDWNEHEQRFSGEKR